MVEDNLGKLPRIPKIGGVIIGGNVDMEGTAQFQFMLDTARSHIAQKFETPSDNPATKLSVRERRRRMALFEQDPIARKLREAMEMSITTGLQTREAEEAQHKYWDRADEYMSIPDPKRFLREAQKASQKKKLN